MLNVQQQCPRCSGAIPREHATKVVFEDCVDTFLFCDFCGYGLEMTVFPDGTILPLEFFERTEPRCFGKFLQRLEDARVA